AVTAKLAISSVRRRPKTESTSVNQPPREDRSATPGVLRRCLSISGRSMWNIIARILARSGKYVKRTLCGRTSEVTSPRHAAGTTERSTFQSYDIHGNWDRRAPSPMWWRVADRGPRDRNWPATGYRVLGARS